MAPRQKMRDPGIWASFICSAGMHAAVFLLVLFWGDLLHRPFTLQETYYVDIVNLPVAAPQAGNPLQTGSDAEAPPPPKSTEHPMALPGRKNQPAATPDAPEESRFEKRMANLESAAAARHEEAALERLRSRLAGGSGRGGMPAGTGGEAGSDYAAYVQSRLRDAFRETISYTSKKPEMVVRISIGIDGRIARQKIERTSGDRVFELAVQHAIERAAAQLPPPPNRRMFEGVFLFRPQGIASTSP
jgi:colicin import membrane protein